ncbi:vitamin B12 dependent-methionine synthase activation domain-containing protein [Marinilabilia rubra]|uniref:AdoMet activation domain-containing protein n=1 Tax=Marinilabilia rubra TaxID=2162893 RepID=A0A2U2BC47_9BACT|nr:vitamin B12 dependent-methionine synthase activation domain-containing protein [Marinilabilia rubra]PWE00603.1 hypothetical protein DDZ16_03110 [Marinilabilia rubra]
MKSVKPEHFRFNISDLDIATSDIEKMARIGDEMPSYDDFLLYELDLLNNNTKIEGGYIIQPGQIISDEIHINNHIFKAGKEVTHFLRKMNHAAIFICTAGKEVSERARQLNNEGHLLEAYLLDVLGSVIVEQAMDKMQNIIKNRLYEKGLKITNRYSPGYCEWNVIDQQLLFSFFPNDFCNVTLTESCLMQPAKTVSGIIGAGQEVTFHKHVCHLCNSINCIYRNTLERKN